MVNENQRCLPDKAKPCARRGRKAAGLKRGSKMAELPKDRTSACSVLYFRREEVIDMKRIENCWEFKKCGREPGGENAERLGICDVAIAVYANGLNGGINGGRICWAINGKFSSHKTECMHCDFFTMLESEESRHVFSLN